MLPKPFCILDKIKKALLLTFRQLVANDSLGSLYHGTKFAVEGISEAQL
jgi:hypothetical protein